MTSRQKKKLSAYSRLVKLLHGSGRAWRSLRAFDAAVQEFSTRVETLQRLAKNQRRHTGGAAEEKRAARGSLCFLAHEISAAICAWALPTGKNELVGRLRFTLTQLRTGRDALCLERCQAIAKTVQANLAELSHYGVTTEKLAGLRERIAVFEKILHQPRKIRGENKKVTAQLAEEFAAADEILYTHLDNLIPQFRHSHPAFHADYKAGRRKRGASGKSDESDPPHQPSQIIPPGEPSPPWTPAVPDEAMID